MRRQFITSDTSILVSDTIASIRNPSGSYPPLPVATQTLNCLPPAGQTMTNVISHLGGFADITNTGAPTEVGLPVIPEDVSSGPGWEYDPRGWVQVLGDNAMLDGYYIPTTVDVRDSRNVTIQNCVIEFGGAAYAISLRHAANAVIRNNTLRGLEQLGPGRLDSGIRDIFSGEQASTPVTIVGNNIYWCSSGIGHITGGGLIQGNYIHDMGFNTATQDDPVAADHTNGIQSEGSTGALLAVRGNTILIDRSQTDAFMLSGRDSPQTNRLLEHNLFAGGGYTVYGRGSQDEVARQIVVRENHFSRIYYPDSGDFGPLAHWEYHPSNIWENNVWDDTGDTIEIAL